MLRALLIVALITSPAFAGRPYYNSCRYGHCVQKVVAAAPVVYPPQTIIQNQNILYPVGQDVYAGNSAAVYQAESQQLQREMARMMDRYQSIQSMAASAPQVITLRLEAATATVAAGAVGKTCTPETQQPNYSMKAGLLESRCFGCHGGAKGVKGKFDLRLDLTCKQKFAALQQVIAGEMPKGGPPLTNDEFGQLVEELAQMPEAGQLPAQPGLPPLEGLDRPAEPAQLPAPPAPAQLPAPPTPPQPEQLPSDRPSLQPGDEGDFSRVRDQIKALLSQSLTKKGR
jgi:hypothetical protein